MNGTTREQPVKQSITGVTRQWHKRSLTRGQRINQISRARGLARIRGVTSSPGKKSFWPSPNDGGRESVASPSTLTLRGRRTARNAALSLFKHANAGPAINYPGIPWRSLSD